MAKKIKAKGTEQTSKPAEQPTKKVEATGNGKKTEKNGDQPKPEKTKRKIAATVEEPSMIIPLVAVFAWVLIAYVIANYDQKIFNADLDRIMMLLTGMVTVLFLFIAPIYRYYRQLTKGFAKTLVFGMAALGILICGYGIYSASSFGEPLAQGVIMAGEGDSKMAEFNVPGDHYRIFLRGSFPLPGEEKAADVTQEPKADQKKVKKNFKLTGNYSVQIRKADGRSVVSDYAGTFEQVHTKRRVSKRGRDYMDVIKTSILKPMDLPAPGEYQIHVLALGEKLHQQVEYAVYRDRQFPKAIALLGLLASFVLGLIDYLIKPLRVTSYFAVTTGMAYGLTAYFLMDASPISPYGTLAIDLLVGIVVGSGVAYVISQVGKKAYASIARKQKWSLA